MRSSRTASGVVRNVLTRRQHGRGVCRAAQKAGKSGIKAAYGAKTVVHVDIRLLTSGACVWLRISLADVDDGGCLSYCRGSHSCKYCPSLVSVSLLRYNAAHPQGLLTHCSRLTE